MSTETTKRWVRDNLERAADGDLDGAERRRLRQALAQEPELAEELRRAEALRAALRRLRPPGVPRGLLRRLWRIPAGDGGSLRLPLALTSTAAAAVVAVTLALMTAGPSPQKQQRERALQEFKLAMGYVRAGAREAQREVDSAVSRGIDITTQRSLEVWQPGIRRRPVNHGQNGG